MTRIAAARPAGAGRRGRHPHPAAGSQICAGRRARQIGSKLRLRGAQARDEAQVAVRRITGELAGLAERAAADAETLLSNARRAVRPANAEAVRLAAAGQRAPVAGRRRGRLRRAVNNLTDLLAASRQIAAQTRQRLSGTPRTGPPGTTTMRARSPRAA